MLILDRRAHADRSGRVPSSPICFCITRSNVWMTRTFPGAPWCRYADDGLVHCKTQAEALAIKAALAERLAACGLEMHPEKTHVVYCKDGSRKEKHPNKKFDFLGYIFRPRVVKNRKRNSLFVSFTPAVSSKALKSMRERTRRLNLRNRADLSLRDISRRFNPVLRGWSLITASFIPRRSIRSTGMSTKRWLLGRCESTNGSKGARRGPVSSSKAWRSASPICSCTGKMEPWARLPDGSGVSREAPAPFCERLGVKFLRPTHDDSFKVLKNNGYHLEHNFGHGEQNLAVLFAAMNLLAFAIHAVLDGLEDLWIKARDAKCASNRFFEHVRTITAYLVFRDWETLMITFINCKPPPEIEKQIGA